jgi:hypothetical protein
MRPDLTEVVPLLQRDVRATLGDAHRQLIEDIAADVQELDVDGKAEKVVNDVQQYFHDTRLMTAFCSRPLRFDSEVPLRVDAVHAQHHWDGFPRSSRSAHCGWRFGRELSVSLIQPPADN